MTRTIRYRRPWVYPAQEAALFCPERFAVVEASTKAGKTLGCIIWIVEQAVQARPGAQLWWVAPLYVQAHIAFRRMCQYLPRGMFRANRTEMTITLPNDVTLVFRSAKDPDALYGEDVVAVVIDEASRLSEAAWHAVRSTLTATRGKARIIGNVKGTTNWAYQLARKAEKGTRGYHYAKLTAYDAVAGGILALEEIEDAKATLPSDVFAELYLAEPATRSRMFAGVPPEVTPAEVPPDARVVRAWDFASTEAKAGRDPDWTVGVKIAQAGGLTYVLDVERFRMNPEQALARFVAVAKADGCDQVVEQEPGSSGKLFIESLRSRLRAEHVTGRLEAANPSGDKETRAFMVAAQWSNQPQSNVRLVRGNWNTDFLDELDYFPNGTHDDQADAFAHAYNYLEAKVYTPGSFRVPGQ